MDTSSAVLVAATFIWVGLVLGISFLEAPLKFRAPGVTLPIGLGIGRLVFRALNIVEAALALVIVVALLAGSPADAAALALGVAIACLVYQLVAVRPRLSRRSDAVLAATTAAAHDAPRSRVHLVYIALEVAKLVALFVGAITTLAMAS